MRILLTNDDGVYAPGLLAMGRELQRLGEVTVVAPDSERSSISQAITLRHPIYHRAVRVKGLRHAHAVSGTPADCVKLGVSLILKRKPDVIVSGINNGSNDGCSVFYSGTVGAAREGALMGIPSVAVSLDTADGIVDHDFTPAARAGLKVVRWVLRHGLPRRTFLNVNVPDVPGKLVKGICFAAQCRVPIHGEFQKRKDPAGRTYYWLTGRPPARQRDQGTDTYLLKNRYIVVAPIHCDATDYDFLNSLKKGKEVR